jgi:hypothetical protein
VLEKTAMNGEICIWLVGSQISFSMDKKSTERGKTLMHPDSLENQKEMKRNKKTQI